MYCLLLHFLLLFPVFPPIYTILSHLSPIVFFFPAPPPFLPYFSHYLLSFLFLFYPSFPLLATLLPSLLSLLPLSLTPSPVLSIFIAFFPTNFTFSSEIVFFVYFPFFLTLFFCAYLSILLCTLPFSFSLLVLLSFSL